MKSGKIIISILCGLFSIPLSYYFIASWEGGILEVFGFPSILALMIVTHIFGYFENSIISYNTELFFIILSLLLITFYAIYSYILISLMVFIYKKIVKAKSK